MKDIAELHALEYESTPAVVASAPGTVRFLGEHTEESDGIVLSAAISQRVSVAVSARRDSSLRFFAADLNERKRTSLANLKYKREDRWANLPKGVLALLFAQGAPGQGLNVTVAGDIPLGIGLGSSAAFVAASAAAFAAALGRPSGNDSIVEMCRAAEADFCGRIFGPAEHLVPVVSRPGTAISVDARNGRPRLVPFDIGQAVILITDSRVPRFSLDTEIQQRAEDCRQCLQHLGRRHHGRSLRDYSSGDLDELMGELPESVRRRCLFIMEEIRRVSDAEDLLARGDLPGFGRVLTKSQAGLRNLLEVSCPEIDWLIKRASEIDGTFCSRLTGKGFGGCTVSIMDRTAVEEYRSRLDEYERIFGFKASAYETTVSGGIELEG
ncbi:MAG TPA: galactokinase family protein [Magnetospirillaceae bacterium]|nr:galactokinase family protein [Magnetospirillaceae bacterium]